MSSDEGDHSLVVDNEQQNVQRTRFVEGPSPYEAVADPAKYRVADATFGTCSHGHSGTLCATSGKVGRNGRSAAIGATLCWLTCASLNNIIARFERHGLISALAARLQTDSKLLSLHVASHAVYEGMAMSTLQEPQRSFFRAHFMEPADVTKRKFGNAAVGHEGDLKCMHALVAQSICGAHNPLGNLCLHYILHLRSQVDSLVNANKTTHPGDADIAASPNLQVCAIVDCAAGMLNFLDQVGVQAVLLPPLQATAEGGADVATAECCAAADVLIVACEGHAPRTRKKHRKH